jgi:hypothetical protein
MPENLSIHEERVRSFWDRDTKNNYESGGKEPFDRWMVMRVEHDLAAHPHRRLAGQSFADVDTYLAGPTRYPPTKVWGKRGSVLDFIPLHQLRRVLPCHTVFRLRLNPW